MLTWAILSLVTAIISGFYGYNGIATVSKKVSKGLFYLILPASVVSWIFYILHL